MRKLIAISLLFCYTLSGNAVHQLMKLPVLISHYAEHKAGNNRLSMMEFVAMHYAAANDHDSRDKELPFKSECTNACATAVHLPQTVTTTLRQPAHNLQPPYAEYKPVFYGLLMHNNIWQPPRYC